MRIAIATATLLTGCQLVFPREATEVDPVHGTLTTKTVRQGTTGFEVTDGTGDAATVVATSGTQKIPVTVTNGEFTFPRSERRYRLEVSFGGEVVEFQDEADELALQFTFAGRDDVVPLAKTTPLTLPAVATGMALPLVASTGQWSSNLALTSTFDWKTAEPTGNLPIGILDGSLNDRLYYLQLTPGAFDSDASAIGKYRVLEGGALAMTDGIAIDLSDTAQLTTTTANGCVRIVAHQESNQQRLQTAFADTPGIPNQQIVRVWEVSSIPALATGHAGEAGLAFALTSNLDLDVTRQYFDPFAGDELAIVRLKAPRPIRFAESSSSVAATVDVAFFDPISLSTDCASNQRTFDDTVALPGDITLGRTPLDTDFQKVTLERPSTVALTWTPDNSRYDVFDVALSEIIVVGNTTGVVPQRHFRTSQPRLEIPDDLLEAGHEYIFEVTTLTGFPEILTGDYATATYPAARSSLFSSVFEVMR